MSDRAVGVLGTRRRQHAVVDGQRGRQAQRVDGLDHGQLVGVVDQARRGAVAADGARDQLERAGHLLRGAALPPVAVGQTYAQGRHRGGVDPRAQRRGEEPRRQARDLGVVDPRRLRDRAQRRDRGPRGVPVVRALPGQLARGRRRRRRIQRLLEGRGRGERVRRRRRGQRLGGDAAGDRCDPDQLALAGGDLGAEEELRGRAAVGVDVRAGGVGDGDPGPRLGRVVDRAAPRVGHRRGARGRAPGVVGQDQLSVTRGSPPTPS
ncbi:MAG: hypothetical protein R3B06_12605 [Kofleriaceae bacterium]